MLPLEDKSIKACRVLHSVGAQIWPQLLSHSFSICSCSHKTKWPVPSGADGGAQCGGGGDGED